MAKERIYSKKAGIDIKASELIYAQMKRNYVEFHTQWGGVYKERITMERLRDLLGDDFLQVSRSCLVRYDQIHHLDAHIVLLDGEQLSYAQRQKSTIVNAICCKRNCLPADFVVQRQRQPKPVRKPPKPEPEKPELVRSFPDGRYLSVTVGRRPLMVNVDSILYVIVCGAKAEIHTTDTEKIQIHRSLTALEAELGEGFVRIFRNCLVSAKAVHSFTDSVNLVNGESLPYSPGQRERLRRCIAQQQKRYIDSLSHGQIPKTLEEYHAHYHCFDNLPVAFTDIEMVFSQDRHAVDWIFRYGNQALARLEKLPLEKMMGASFSSLFANMDAKWLRSYEQAALFGKTMELLDYSPEINANLKIICFPTFPGHCGCILFDMDRLESHTGLISQMSSAMVP